MYDEDREPKFEICLYNILRQWWKLIFLTFLNLRGMHKTMSVTHIILYMIPDSDRDYFCRVGNQISVFESSKLS